MGKIFLSPKGLDVRDLEQATDGKIKLILGTVQVCDWYLLLCPRSTKPSMQTELSIVGQ